MSCPLRLTAKFQPNSIRPICILFGNKYSLSSFVSDFSLDSIYIFYRIRNHSGQRERLNKEDLTKIKCSLPEADFDPVTTRSVDKSNDQ
jgi:hypothetical protein